MKGARSAAKAVVANDGYNRPGKNPFICRFIRVIIVNSAAGGILAVNGIARGTVGAVGHRGVDAAVRQA